MTDSPVFCCLSPGPAGQHSSGQGHFPASHAAGRKSGPWDIVSAARSRSGEQGVCMARITIPDEFMDFEIDGEVVAGPVSTEYDSRGRRRARCMKATLYLKSDGTYVLHQVNESLVWHVDGGVDHVRKPEEWPASELDRHAVYC